MAGRLAAPAAAIGFVWFLATAAVVQSLNPHAVAATPISAYLHGPQSGWFQTAYYVLATALLSLACCISKKPGRRLFRLAVPSLAVAAFAVALVAYAYSPWPLPGNPSHRSREVMHVASAFVAFLAVTLAMFFETPILWRRRWRIAILAYATGVLLLEIAAALAPLYNAGIYGALEKLSIAGLVFWLLAAALQSVVAR